MYMYLKANDICDKMDSRGSYIMCVVKWVSEHNTRPPSLITIHRCIIAGVVTHGYGDSALSSCGKIKLGS